VSDQLLLLIDAIISFHAAEPEVPQHRWPNEVYDHGMSSLFKITDEKITSFVVVGYPWMTDSSAFTSRGLQ